VWGNSQIQHCTSPTLFPICMLLPPWILLGGPSVSCAVYWLHSYEVVFRDVDNDFSLQVMVTLLDHNHRTGYVDPTSNPVPVINVRYIHCTLHGSLSFLCVRACVLFHHCEAWLSCCASHVAGRTWWVNASSVWLFYICTHNFSAKGEGKVVPVHAIKACEWVEV